jgi:hypothetical protein
MKQRLHTFAFIALLLPAVLFASDILDHIGNAIRSGNAAAIAQYFDANVDLTILEKESIYSKQQAQMVIQDFFAKNPVSSFTIIHRGSSAQGSTYGIGTLIAGGQTFRVYYFVKQKNEGYLIQEMRFERQK